MDSELVFEVLKGVGILIAVIIAIVLAVRVLMSYILTRILSVGCSIASIFLAFPLMELAGAEGGWDAGEGLTLQIIAAVLTLLAWLFFIGPSLFDVSWDGDEVWVDINIFGQVDISPAEDSTFFISLFAGAPVVAVAYFLLAPMADFSVVFIAMPIITLAITVIGFFVGRFIER